MRYSPPVWGLGFWAILPDKRRIVRNNLRRVLGERPALQEEREVAAVFSNYASCLTEAMLLDGRRYAMASLPRGVERYQACAAKGRGVIIVTAHTAGWEFAGSVMRSVHPGEVWVVMQRERDEHARAIQDRARERAGVKVAHIGDSAFDALPLLHALRRNAVVAMQLDRVPPGMRFRTAHLPGGTWRIPEGPLTLAAVSGAPLLPIFTRRLDFMQYEAEVMEPIEISRKPSPEQLDRAAQQMANAMRAFIERHPTQWFHFVDESNAT
ncbi:MAG: lysophospholipid acyltransferase family protein [Polyangiaceae bacterium]|nr:lysophospholipid acyltransferase family protein [Polyangiaceae bacterium]